MNWANMHRMPDGECLIYAIRNTVTGNMYVGSTIEPRRRWNVHRCNLRSGKHTSFVLQRAWDKHSEMAFEFVPLLVCEAKDRNDFEAGFIRSMGEYNLMKDVGVPPAGSMAGLKLSVSAREKIAAAAKARHARNRDEKLRPLCERAWAIVLSGTPKYKACKEVGISHSTFWQWIGENGLKEEWNL